MLNMDWLEQFKKPQTSKNKLTKAERMKMSHMLLDAADVDDPSEAGAASTRAAQKASNAAVNFSSDVEQGLPLAECYPAIADDKDERLYADVRRHWLGRALILLAGGFITLIMIILAVLSPKMARSLNYTTSATMNMALALVFIFVAVMVIFGTLLSLWVYNQSRMLITNENVIEIRQMSLFSRKVSHLNMINVEDVTVIKRGILQTIFNYGTLTTETAGEQDNFVFINTPTPDIYRRMIINAHEAAIEALGSAGVTQKVHIANNNL